MIPSEDRFKIIASGYLLLFRDNTVLLARRINTGYRDGYYSVPAGHLDPHETIRNCCLREAKEEIGIEISSQDLQLVHIMHRKEIDERLDFFFTTQVWVGEIMILEPTLCDDLTWFPIDSLPDNTVPYIKSAIEHYKQGNFYSEFGWK